MATAQRINPVTPIPTRTNRSEAMVLAGQLFFITATAPFSAQSRGRSFLHYTLHLRFRRDNAPFGVQAHFPGGPGLNSSSL
jgi:hypothetical protein